MPRMQPPKGYIRSKEVQDILNISPAMIREYVNKRKIKHFVPPGRTQGFYLESDVRRLANELEVFLNLEEETETVNFALATEEDIPACIELNRSLFIPRTNASNMTLAQKWTKWIQKNPEVVYVLKRNKEVIGITMVLPFKPDSKKLEQILYGDISILLGDIDVSAKDIEEYKVGNHVELYIAEIGIKPSLDKDLRRKYGAKLISKFMEAIVNLGKRGVVIENIIAVGATRSGIRLLQHFGFSEIIFPRPDTRVFTINMKESGAPITRAYREAFQDFQQSSSLLPSSR